MNREIKFRGKRLDTGEWVYGDLLHGKHDIVWIVVDAEEALYPTSTTEGSMPQTQRQNLFRVDPATVGQYVGLEDKTGLEIYDGDILSDGENHAVVLWEAADLQYILNDIDEYVRGNYDEPAYAIDDKQGWVALKIIGNIHDNPELLK
jgi:uncharacterized phage protein (TIGR01671 family)